MKTAWITLFLAGCARLPAGPIAPLQQPGPPPVVLIRGFLDWYSGGVDTLGGQLPHAVVYRDEQWDRVAEALSRSSQTGPLMLIGFSYGADDVISIARRLCRDHRPVKLLITIDPVTPGRVPPNVTRCVNFYESNGVWDVFPWLRGVPLSADAGRPAIENINIRHRPDLIVPGTSHATIAANPHVRAAIVREVIAAVQK